MSLDHEPKFSSDDPAIQEAGLMGVSWDDEGAFTEIALSIF
jgi:hypothetical protein